MRIKYVFTIILQNVAWSAFALTKDKLRFEMSLLLKYPALVAEWVYERLQIQVAESHRSQV